MPRSLVRDSTKEKNALLFKRLKGEVAASNMTVNEIAARSGIAGPTLYARLAHPETFRIHELRAVYKTLKIPEDDEMRTSII